MLFSLSICPRGYSFIWPIRGCASGQGMVIDLSVLNRVYNWYKFFVSRSTRYCLHDWFDLLDEFCLYSKYTKTMIITWICSGVHFVLSLNKALKLGVVLNGVCIWGIFCPKQGQGQRITYTHWPLVEYPPPPLPPGRSFNFPTLINTFHK